MTIPRQHFELLSAHLTAQGWADADDILGEIQIALNRATGPLLACWTLPWPPTVNSYWAYRSVHPKSGAPGFIQTYITPRGRAYREEVGKMLLGKRAIPSGTPLRFLVRCYPPDRRERDLDNLGKALLDAIANCGRINSDFDIWSLTYERVCQSAPPGRVVVEVYRHEIGQQPIGYDADTTPAAEPLPSIGYAAPVEVAAAAGSLFEYQHQAPALPAPELEPARIPATFIQAAVHRGLDRNIAPVESSAREVPPRRRVGDVE